MNVLCKIEKKKDGRGKIFKRSKLYVFAWGTCIVFSYLSINAVRWTFAERVKRKVSSLFDQKCQLYDVMIEAPLLRVRRELSAKWQGISPISIFFTIDKNAIPPVVSTVYDCLIVCSNIIFHFTRKTNNISKYVNFEIFTRIDPRILFIRDVFLPLKKNVCYGLSHFITSSKRIIIIDNNLLQN